MTIYATDLDLATIERRAFVAGHSELAEVAAYAMDREQELTDERTCMEDDIAKERAQREEAQTALDDLKRAIRDRLDEMDRILSDCKRISGRKELEAALQAIYNETV